MGAKTCEDESGLSSDRDLALSQIQELYMEKLSYYWRSSVKEEMAYMFLFGIFFGPDQSEQLWNYVFKNQTKMPILTLLLKEKGLRELEQTLEIIHKNFAELEQQSASIQPDN